MSPRLMLPALAVGLLVSAAVAAPASAEETTPVTKPSLIFSIVTAPVAMERPEVTLDRSLRDDGPRRASSPVTGEVLPDGSVRYGRVTVSVKNPCPPDHDEPMPLPGRRARK